MPTSSKTPPAETSAKSSTGSRPCAGATKPAPAKHGASLPLRSELPDRNSAGHRVADQRLPDQSLFDQIHDAVFTCDLDGVITSCNRGVDHYGYEPEDWIGRNFSNFYSANQPAFSASQVIAAVLAHARFDAATNCRAKAGQHLNVQLALHLLRDAAGAPAGILGVSIATTSIATTAAKRVEHADTNPAATPVLLARREIDGTPLLIASPIMHKFMGMVDRVAGHSETVLVTGETGTGKELVARTIHESSSRQKKPLIDINCAALPEHLVESELFGYEKGAFSGADSSKPGLFELADKSTIFLDEIGELQPQVQVKLLRVLDGQPYYRLGGNRKIIVDVRVVAATNQDLESAVKEGRFRKDLFHRLSQFQLRVPPLRERPEDVAALARHFLALKASDKTFTPDAIVALEAYPWPGNIRELRNLVAKLAMATEARQVGASEVAAALYGEPAVERRSSGAVPLGNLENMEEQMIIRALEQCGGHRAQAAEQLGISRRTLSRKLREYEINLRPGESSSRLGVISEDQQKFFRAKVNLPVTLRNPHGKELHVSALNLSTGGMGLDVVHNPNGFAGLLDVHFLLPDSETAMQAKGRLVWADAGGRAGLRFVVIEPALFEQLQHWTNQKMKDEGWEIPT